MKKAEVTRQQILQKAFELIYTKGYQNTSLDDILSATDVTKGAFYYHFKNKDEMGLAIINEILRPTVSNNFIKPLQKDGDPVEVIYDMIYYLLMKDEFLKVEYGCPTSNLTQEMTPWNVDFSKALEELTEAWNKTLIAYIEKGKKEGYVRKDVNARQVTTFIVSGYWGIRNLGKLENSKSVYKVFLKEFRNYLNNLR
jgi:AcrR family transcriptional regulator